MAGTREDLSGAALEEVLTGNGFDVVERRVVADGVQPVANALRAMSLGFGGVVVTTGGTGFSPRDVTPEATQEVIHRDAPGLAEAMRLVSPLGRLSRGIAGTCESTIILNTPGSPKGARECLEAVIDVLPHALALLVGAPTEH